MSSRTKKFRGKRTHGRGQKAGRGAGAMGGRGHAGFHKHKWIYTVKYMPDYFGRQGFKSKTRVEKKAINICDIEQQLNKFLKEQKAKEVSGKIEIDLKAIGFDKLLGKGSPTKIYKIIVESASENAVEKIKNAKGEVVLAKE